MVNVSAPNVSVSVTNGVTGDGGGVANLSNDAQCNLAPAGDYHLFVYEGFPITAAPAATSFVVTISFKCISGLAASGSAEVGFGGIFPLD